MIRRDGGISLIPPRKIGLEKIPAQPPVLPEKVGKNGNLGKRKKKSGNDFCVMVIMGLTSGHSKCLIHAFTVDYFFAFIPTRLSLPKLNPRTPTQTVWAKPPRTVRTEHKMSQRNLARFAGLVF